MVLCIYSYGVISYRSYQLYTCMYVRPANINTWLSWITQLSSFQVKSIRETFAKVISDKHEDVMAKFGAILAQGIIDAGRITYFYCVPGR